jgi:predicted MPP superfamily phosphohydrolase
VSQGGKRRARRGARLGQHLQRWLQRSWLGLRLRERIRHAPEITTGEVELRRGHADLDGLRVAFISDVHAGHWLDARDLVSILERVAASEPDLVCLGGDLVDGFAEEFEILADSLHVLDPPLGIVATPGNHEYYADASLSGWRAALAAHQVTVLCNQGTRSKRGGASLWLAGIDDWKCGRPDMRAAVEGAAPDEPILLLSHQPDMLPHAAEHGVDLMLSGHTHGGQVRPWGWTVPLPQTRLGLWHGHFEHERTQLYVGRGVGFSGLPLRWNAPAEIPLLTLRVR